MSLAVDQYLLEMMKREDDMDLLLGNNEISEAALDHLCGWNEETQAYDPSQGMMFPQPIHTID